MSYFLALYGSSKLPGNGSVKQQVSNILIWIENKSGTEAKSVLGFEESQCPPERTKQLQDEFFLCEQKMTSFCRCEHWNIARLAKGMRIADWVGVLMGTEDLSED